MSYNDQLLRIVDSYRADGQSWPASKHDIAAWAVRTKLWQPQAADMVSRCAEELSRAMREEYVTDPQGRRVRAKHAATVNVDGKQTTLWTDIRDPHPQFMAIAFQQRRQHIVGECRQLKTDVDSFNENARPATPYQLILNFEDDVAEMEAASAAE
jgi:hypothetical protein